MIKYLLTASFLALLIGLLYKPLPTPSPELIDSFRPSLQAPLNKDFIDEPQDSIYQYATGPISLGSSPKH